MQPGDAIRALTREFVDGFNSADVDRMMRPYATLYVDVNLPRPLQTLAERAAYYRNIVARRDRRIEVTPEEIVVDGAHAVVRGSILLFKIDGSGVSRLDRELRYMELWENHDGWKSIWGIDAEIHE